MTIVTDVKESDFAQAVLARSYEVPVVVDFWAPWCGPCRTLGPTLEREVLALDGRVELAKVDVDAAPSLSAQFNVRGIPAVMAFRDGKVAHEFTGVRDATFVQDWLAALQPSPAVLGLQAAGDEASLRRWLSDEEVGVQASLRLAQWLIDAGREAEVADILDGVSGPDAETADTLRQRAAFALDSKAYGGEAIAATRLAANPSDLDALWAMACAKAARQQWPEALEGFLAVVGASRSYRDDGGRKAMVTLFRELGHSHDITREYRRRLQTIL